jgi:hypothetical protein
VAQPLNRSPMNRCSARTDRVDEFAFRQARLLDEHVDCCEAILSLTKFEPIEELTP